MRGMQTRRRFRLGIVLAALALTMIACGNGAPTDKTAASRNGKPSASSGATARSGYPSAGTSASPTSSTGASGDPTPAADRPYCDPIKFISPARGTDRPHIWYEMSRIQDWRCDRLKPGATCAVGFSGSWAGSVDYAGDTYFRFAAWEHGKPKPVTTTEVGPLPAYGEFTSLSTRFLYKVGNTDKVRFYLQLLNAAKVVVATGDTFVYSTNCVEK